MGKLNDLQQKRFATLHGGGTTARERIAMLFDAGSFVELDAFVKNRYKELGLTEKDAPAEGVVTGYGTVDGRLVYAYSQDSAVIGGSIGEMGAKKICKVLDMAVKMGAPVVAICDSNGARLEEGVDALCAFADILNKSAKLSGVVPQISVILGACAGGAAFMPAMSDFVFVVDNKTQMFLNAPSVLGKETDEFGTALSHAEKTGVASVRCESEADCFAKVKKLIGYLPEQPPVYLDMTVDEYLKFNYELKGCTLDREQHLAEVCEVVKIKDVYNRVIRNLSKGYRQRVGIAQALIGNPKVIIFDEPTVGLDPKQIIEIRNLIRSLGKAHTVVLSTHILQEVQAVCDRIVIINKGKIVANEKTENIANVMSQNRRFNVKIVGPQKDVLAMLRAMPGITYAEGLAERDGDAYSYMIESDAGIDIRKKLFYQLVERNWPLVGIESMGMSLEDIFISVVNNSEEAKTQRHMPQNKSRRRNQSGALEQEIGAALYADAEKKRTESALADTDEDED